MLAMRDFGFGPCQNLKAIIALFSFFCIGSAFGNYSRTKFKFTAWIGDFW